MNNSRFLERFWSLFLIGELGFFRVVSSVMRALIVMLLLVVALLGIGWLLVILFPDLVTSLIVVFVEVVKIVFFIWIFWRLVRLIFGR